MINRIKQHRQTLSIILLACFAAALFEVITHLDIGAFMIAVKTPSHRSVVHIADMETHNLEVEKNRVVNRSDPWMLIGNEDNRHIRNLEINITGLSVSSLPVRVCPSDNREGFDQDNSIKADAASDERAVFVRLNSSASFIRVSIGGKGNRYTAESIILNPSAFDYLIAAVKNSSRVRMLLLAFAICFLLLLLRDFSGTAQWLFRYRWGIGAAAIAFCTILKLHGSSIGEIAQYTGGADVSKLFGLSRSIRSDEFVAFTQMALAQARSGFRWFSDIWGYSPHDMFLVYGQPVKNLATVFRPFSTVYILFGPDYGLAFFWSARFIILLLVSFEFGRLFTRDDRLMSVIYAVLVTLSPVVQWWFSINGLVEMLIFGQGALLSLHRYFREKGILRRTALSALIGWCMGGYILTLYPAWMVPLFYVFLACLAAVIIEDRREITVRGSDVLIWAGTLAVVGVCMVYVYMVSKDTLTAVTNTVFPGNRRNYGGFPEQFSALFRGWQSYLWALQPGKNPCEQVGFLDFFPLGLILSVFAMVRHKKRDVWMIALWICNVFLLVYCFFGFAKPLGVISMMNRSTVPRTMVAVSFLNLILMLRCLSCCRLSRRSVLVLVAAAPVFTGIAVYAVRNELDDPHKYLLVAAGTVLAYLALSGEKEKRRFLLSVCLVSFAGGGLVNPVNRGLASLYKSPVVKEIRAVNDKEAGFWAVNGGVAIVNLPTVAGGKCLNAVATYPDRQLWKDLGLEAEEDIWNRYAHIEVSIDDTTYLEKKSEDLLCLHAAIDSLRELGVDYILSTTDLSDREGCHKIRQVVNTGFSIWGIDP